MEQKTTLAQSIDLAVQKAQYDAECKKVLAEKIQKVYSVWICMNPPKARNHTITGYSLTEQQYVGKVKEKEEYYDLMHAVMICLGGSEKEE